jgi:hypothetical protein
MIKFAEFASTQATVLNWKEEMASNVERWVVHPTFQHPCAAIHIWKMEAAPEAPSFFL